MAYREDRNQRNGIQNISVLFKKLLDSTDFIFRCHAVPDAEVVTPVTGPVYGRMVRVPQLCHKLPVPQHLSPVPETPQFEAKVLMHGTHGLGLMQLSWKPLPLADHY